MFSGGGDDDDDDDDGGDDDDGDQCVSAHRLSDAECCR